MVVESQYFPSIQFWAFAQKHGCVKLEKNENYQKRSYRNKCVILSSNGALTLSVPLKKGKNNQTKISDVIISYEDNWIKKHLTSIESAYRSAPYFEYYFDEIEQILLSKYTCLYDLNFHIIDWFGNLLHIPILETEVYKQECVMDFRHKILPKSRALDYPKYIQVFSEKLAFESDLSILDLLFCKGPETRSYINRVVTNI